MECPHLNENVKTISSIEKSSWTCSVCETDQSPWLCLTCGVVACGRYVSGHAQIHHDENKPLHSVCMDFLSWAVYCYQCDEFVINDTEAGLIDKIRQQIQALQSNNFDDCPNESDNENPTTPENTSTTSSVQSNNCTTTPSASLSPHHSLTTTTIATTKTTTGVASPSKSHNQQNSKNSSTKENRVLTRRRGSSESQENNKKRLKMDESTTKPKIKAKTPGLRNLGNTCFMNAVLQSLSNIQSFCGYIKQLPSLESKLGKKKIQTRSCNKDGDVFVIEELRKTLVALWGGSKSAISPDSLFNVIWKVVPRFRGYQQQDAHEFMRYLLDRLHSELLTLLPYPNSTSPYIGPKGKSTIVTTIFGGILQNEVKCLMCGLESKKHDPFLDLSLDIPAKFSSKCPSPKNGEQICHLDDCLSSFTEVEELEETELYMCNNCKKRQRSTKKFWIRRLPNVLCLHLKRFRWNSYFRMKVDTYIDFPLRGLNMNKYLLNNLHETRNSYSGSNEYDLAAVIVHHGSGAGSGHYTSYATNEGRWYHFNDSTVSCVEEEVVGRCKAYILFYVKRDIKVPHYFSPEKDDEQQQ